VPQGDQEAKRDSRASLISILNPFLISFVDNISHKLTTALRKSQKSHNTKHSRFNEKNEEWTLEYKVFFLTDFITLLRNTFYFFASFLLLGLKDENTIYSVPALNYM
jgi:hypothetical protein